MELVGVECIDSIVMAAEDDEKGSGSAPGSAGGTVQGARQGTTCIHVSGNCSDPSNRVQSADGHSRESDQRAVLAARAASPKMRDFRGDDRDGRSEKRLDDWHIPFDGRPPTISNLLAQKR